ncbi:hypothetical protein BJV78DRAFT_1350638 [Lactifluus subvellereus]|nr:hypothetical protein BJV78DRAFT_1350638 [Lactifluus subvellereus]
MHGPQLPVREASESTAPRHRGEINSIRLQLPLSSLLLKGLNLVPAKPPILMRLTRAATRALLKGLDQRQGDHLEPSPPSTTVDVLPEDVLLEIFDSCRQSFEQEPRYERIWNSNNGWFKLAHVCRK